MSTPTVPVIDYSAMMREAATQQREMISTMIQPLRDAVVHAVGDAFLVTALAVILIGALICVLYGVRSGVWHVLLPCLAVGTILVLLASQALLAFPFTWGSVGLGFLMIGMVILRGHRFALRLLRFVDA